MVLLHQRVFSIVLESGLNSEVWLLETEPKIQKHSLSLSCISLHHSPPAANYINRGNSVRISQPWQLADPAWILLDPGLAPIVPVSAAHGDPNTRCKKLGVLMWAVEPQYLEENKADFLISICHSNFSLSYKINCNNYFLTTTLYI